MRIRGEGIGGVLPLLRYGPASHSKRKGAPGGFGPSGQFSRGIIPGKRETNQVRRRRPPTRVMLKAVAVWELLERLDMSQNQLARLAGISPSHLSQVMNGKSSPSPRVRRQLMETLRVDDFHQLFLIVPVGGGTAGEGGGE